MYVSCYVEDEAEKLVDQTAKLYSQLSGEVMYNVQILLIEFFHNLMLTNA